MNLKDNFHQFCSEKKIAESKYRFNRFIFDHTSAIAIGFKVASTVTEFVTTGTPFALVKGAFDILKGMTSSYHPDVFFSEANGWKEAKPESIPISFFIPGLIHYKFTPVQFGDPNHSNTYSGKIFHTEIGDIGFADVNSDESAWATRKLYYRHLEVNEVVFFDFIIAQLLKQVGSNFISIEIQENKMQLIPEESYAVASERSREYANYVRKCGELGINRSFLLYGPPGTGKTTLAQAIISDLNFKTLKFRYNEMFDFTKFKFLLDKIKPDAMIIDDFDQTEMPEQLLEFLEVARKKIKLIIGVVNSLESFHPAVIRPGRFDEIIKIDSLELDTVRVALGDLYPTYGAKVRNWPIAYINELVILSKLVARKDLLKNYKELQVRVDKQLEDISEIAEPVEKAKKK